MLHLVLYALLAIIIAGGLFLAATRFLPAGEQIAPPLRDEPVWDLPAGRGLRPEDVDGVRLPVALRGYRFAETDTLLDRLAGELRLRDAEIARLRGYPPIGDAAVGDGPGPVLVAGPGPDLNPEPEAAVDAGHAADAADEANEADEAGHAADETDDSRYAPPSVITGPVDDDRR